MRFERNRIVFDWTYTDKQAILAYRIACQTRYIWGGMSRGYIWCECQTFKACRMYLLWRVSAKMHWPPRAFRMNGRRHIRKMDMWKIDWLPIDMHYSQINLISLQTYRIAVRYNVTALPPNYIPMGEHLSEPSCQSIAAGMHEREEMEKTQANNPISIQYMDLWSIRTFHRGLMHWHQLSRMHLPSTYTHAQ